MSSNEQFNTIDLVNDANQDLVAGTVISNGIYWENQSKFIFFLQALNIY